MSAARRLQALKAVLVAALLSLWGQDLQAAFKIGGAVEYGEEITVYLPTYRHLHNKGGSDGYGLCVFTSVEHCADYQTVAALLGFRDWMTQHPGGGYPSKLDAMIARLCAERKLPVPRYIQHTGGDMAFLRAALATGRMVAVTYCGNDRVYYPWRVAHMVNLVHLSKAHAVILDNNYPGQYLWMSPAEFEERWKPFGGGWAVVLLDPPPPPVPTNRRVAMETTQALLYTWFGVGHKPIQPERDPAYPAEIQGYEWRTRDDDPSRSYLYRYGQQIGGYCRREGRYRAYDPMTKAWGDYTKCPIILPPRVRAETGPKPVQVTGDAQVLERRGGYEWRPEGRDGRVIAWHLYHRTTYSGVYLQTDSPVWRYFGFTGTPSGRVFPPLQARPLPPAVTPKSGIEAHTRGETKPRPVMRRPANYGLDTGRIPSAEGYSLSGKACGRKCALDAMVGCLTKAEALEEARRCWLVVVGDDALLNRVADDMEQHSDLAWARDNLRLKCYLADHWAVKEYGYAPGLTLQMPDGPVIWRMRAYAGPVALAGAVRKADPNYDPSKDPDPTTPNKARPVIDRCKEIPAWAYVAAASLLLLFRKEQPK